MIINYLLKKLIIFRLNYMDLEENYGCTFDYIEIYENVMINNSLTIKKIINRLCGDKIPETQQISSSNIIFVNFVSDHTTKKSGFKMVLTATLGFYLY